MGWQSKQVWQNLILNWTFNIIGRNTLAHTLNPTHSALRMPRTCRMTTPAPIPLNRINHSHQSVSQAATKPRQSSNQSSNQSVNQYPATTATTGIQQSSSHNNQSHLSISHQLKWSVILRQPLFLSLAASHYVNSHCTIMYVLSLARNAHITQQHSTLQSLAHRLHSH